MMNYIAYTFKVRPAALGTEILIAQLGFVGFESFVENEQGVVAYIQESEWDDEILKNIQILSSNEFEITFEKETIEQTNWNKEWEKNFESIEVDGRVLIRAPFHEVPKLEYDIVIEPKMSFGTGHHETTHMMIQHLLQLKLNEAEVLDMGCGTGILAIFAEMRGAKKVDAIDNDEWCYLNSLENVQRNGCRSIQVYEGDASLLKDKKYDLIIANINRNILLNDMGVYNDCLKDHGTLLLSGFYKKDIPMIHERCTEMNLELKGQIERNNWVALKYIK